MDQYYMNVFVLYLIISYHTYCIIYSCRQFKYYTYIYVTTITCLLCKIILLIILNLKFFKELP